LEIRDRKAEWVFAVHDYEELVTPDKYVFSGNSTNLLRMADTNSESEKVGNKIERRNKQIIFSVHFTEPESN
jgi:photosystem II stability/assembly factor-like uncharacterized protein